MINVLDGSWVMGHGSWVMDHGSCIGFINSGPNIEDGGQSVNSWGSCLYFLFFHVPLINASDYRVLLVMGCLCL